MTGGEADIAIEPMSSQLDEILVQLRGAGPHCAQAGINFIALHTEVPPFDNVEVRRAVNFAVDRERVVQILGGDAAAFLTCQQLPPNFPGYEPYCPYDGRGDRTGEEVVDRSGSRGGPETRRRSGTAGMRVTYWFDTTDLWVLRGGPRDYMVEMLESLDTGRVRGPSETGSV